VHPILLFLLTFFTLFNSCDLLQDVDEKRRREVAAAAAKAAKAAGSASQGAAEGSGADYGMSK
jgi:hypothetical protein